MTTLTSSHRRPIHLMLDFDGTLTVKDTMLAYGSIVDNRDVRLGRPPTGTEPFKEFGAAWMHDYTTHEQAYSPKPQDRKDIKEEIAWLASLAKIETASVSRVEQSGFFRHVTKDDVQKASESLLQSGQIAFRTGWERLFSKSAPFSNGKVAEATEPGVHISINSVNWSEAFIRATIQSAATRSSLSQGTRRNIDEMPIRANELHGLEDSDGASGLLNDNDFPSNRTADDKYNNLTKLYRNDTHNIYVGDSPTDLRCLLAADLGICIRNDPMSSSSKELADIFARTGYEVPNVAACKSWSDECLRGEKGGLLWASNFDEVADLFERLQNAHAEDTV
ncbi:hypothetical protein Q7P37_002735 [Cladosporium fusiforme]